MSHVLYSQPWEFFRFRKLSRALRHFPMAPGMFIGATVMPWEGSEDAVKPPWIPGVIVRRYRLIKFPLAGMISSSSTSACQGAILHVFVVYNLFSNALVQEQFDALHRTPQWVLWCGTCLIGCRELRCIRRLMHIDANFTGNDDLYPYKETSHKWPLLHCMLLYPPGIRLLTKCIYLGVFKS